jgi:hypothetical protein
MCIDGWEQRPSLSFFCLIAAIVLSLFFLFSLDCYALYVYARLRKEGNRELVRLQPLPASLCFSWREQEWVRSFYVEEIRVERALSCSFHSHIQKESTTWFRARKRKRVILLREYVHTLCLMERELCVKIRKFHLIATIVLSLFFFFSLDCYVLYIYTRLRKEGNRELVWLQPPACLPLLFLERVRVSTVFLRRGDTSIESILMFVSLSYTEREYGVV